MESYQEKVDNLEDRLESAEYSIEELKTRSVNDDEITELREKVEVELPAQKETIKELDGRMNDMAYEL